MKKRPVILLVFFGVLLLSFYAVLMATTDFGKVKLPVLNSVHPFSFTKQDGKQVTEKDVTGKVYVAEFFFTTCKGICPKMNRNMQSVYNELKSEKHFLILSHTVDPETDSVAQLKKHAESLGASPENWWFLTGTKENLYRTARESYLLDDPDNSTKNITEQFLHTQFFALVDKTGRVRGIYDGLKQDELKTMKGDIYKLLEE
jgi:protein SCO1/2